MEEHLVGCVFPFFLGNQLNVSIPHWNSISFSVFMLNTQLYSLLIPFVYFVAVSSLVKGEKKAYRGFREIEELSRNLLQL